MKARLFLYALTLSLCLLQTPPLHAEDKYPNAIQDLRVTKGKTNILEAWFSHPTRRYRHFVLGSNYEPSILNVMLRTGERLTFQSGSDAVFEDRLPRLHDLDGDGADEIIVVRAYLQGGAALSVLSIRSGKLEVIAETPDMGHPFGWLNPAGIADFDGDGHTEIAFVRKPHVLGQLELWEFKNNTLRKEFTLPDASNHSIGSKHLQLSAVADFNKDGLPDLALPSKKQRKIRILSFAGKPKEIGSFQLPEKVNSDFRLINKNDKLLLEVGLKNRKHIIDTSAISR